MHPELMSVQKIDIGGAIVERATVFIPQEKINYFLNRITQYLNTANEDKPRNQELVDRIQSIGFGDRMVILLQATVEQLGTAVDVLDDLAELRRPHDPTQFLAGHDAMGQAEWIEELVGRLKPADEDAPAVCVVDTGVYRDHPLLQSSLGVSDCHAAESTWPVHDDRGHGTQMAGLALYGDLGGAFTAPGLIRLRHRLESVKLLPPPPGENAPELYGAVTAAGTSRVEIQAFNRRRVYSIAVTAQWWTKPDGAAPGPVFGQPSSWSATLDALAAGRSVTTEDDGLVFLNEAEDAARRLFLLSAGNVHAWEDDHLTRSDVEPVEDPAQAWNVLTIGAFTELDNMAGAPPGFDGWTPLAPRGELSPFSRTSVACSRTWPAKSDVVLEGGNVARSPNGTDYDTPDNLQLLTTNAPLMSSRLLTTTHATSAATAQAAALAASVMAVYPALWPETVRALIAHSAEWTPAMHVRFPADGKKRSRIALLRRYGMGVPDLLRATRSAADALTLVVQDVIHPFNGGKMREIHFHDLPWPIDILTELGPAQVRLRVTLSYFIEPNPGRRGWRSRYSYASHGLRFGIRRVTESDVAFQKRINQKALLRHARGEESIDRRRLAWCGVVQEMEDLWPSGVALRGAVSNHLKLR